ncbi:energy-coupling factor ABC transporter ATP-binding protein [Granulicatella elegans]|uniref:energy-coupling factor ABC transporter ATP-binding protein n=1 Tax=Granulicatella elegans TaxID=137732 RepID=UPI001D15D97C|nr:energy-coupling factor ABC transporter ATP-binding protein [Granulicatella elegans]UEA32164.1 energy-coupling factor ABC transporter ATP-binding protein [Granulicatella elegans]
MNELTQPVISIKNIYFNYQNQDTREALSDVSLDVFEGEWLAIIGHNGSGKSTLAKMMNGLLEASSGEIYIDGELLMEETVYEARRKVGMVFQNPDNQFVGTTVEDDIAFGLENIGMSREEMVQKINASLEMVRMTSFKEKEPARLSGGQKQRVAIAGMIALAPKVVILDEATSMLDPQGRFEVISTIQQLHKDKGITVISITHDLDEAAQADRVLLMEGGKVNRIGKPSEIFGMGTALVDKGLDVPFSEKLKAVLKEKGLNVPNEYLDEEGLVEWLWTSVLNK